jgi:WD40 repeat protein
MINEPEKKQNKLKRLIRFSLASLILSLVFSKLYGFLIFSVFPTPLDSFLASILAVDKNLVQHTGEISSVVISNDNKIIISAGFDGEINIWHLKTGQLIRSLKLPDNAVTSIAITLNSKQLVSGQYDKTVRF